VPEGISPPMRDILTFMHLRKGIIEEEAVLAEVTVLPTKSNRKAIIFDHKDDSDMFLRNIG
jgi:hypothetical protein